MVCLGATLVLISTAPAQDAALPARSPQMVKWEQFSRSAQAQDATEAQEATVARSLLARYRQWEQDNAPLEPSVAVQVSDAMAAVQAYSLNDTDAALAIYKEALDRSPETNLSLLGSAVKLLIARRRAPEAVHWVQTRWEQLLAAPPEVSSPVLQQYARAMTQVGKKAELVAGLEEVLARVPALLDDATQSRPHRERGASDAALLSALSRWGWMYEELVSDLLAAGRVDEALSWAKVRFVTSDFQASSLDRATRMLGRVLLAKDPSLRLGQQWTQAQQGDNVPNPLASVPLPDILVQTSGKGADSIERVTLSLMRGQYHAAMRAALAGIEAQPDSPLAQRQIARVFVANDLNLKRANAFAVLYGLNQSIVPDANINVPTNGNQQVIDPLPSFWEDETPTVAKDLVAKVGTLQIEPVFMQAVTVPLLIAQLRGGTLNPEAGWKSGTLKLSDIEYILRWGGLVDGEGQTQNKKTRVDLAGLLTLHAPGLVRPTPTNQNVRLAVGDYYRSLKDRRAEAVYNTLLQEATTMWDPQGGQVRTTVTQSTTCHGQISPSASEAQVTGGAQTQSSDPAGFLNWSHRPWFFEPTVNRLAEYYSEAGQMEQARTMWLALEQTTQEIDPVASSVAALESARLSQQMGDQAQAQRQYNRIASYGYGWSTGLGRFDQAEALIKAEKYEAARDLLLQPLQGESTEVIRVALLTSLAYCYYHLGEQDKARATAQEALDQFEANSSQPTRNVEWQAKRAQQILNWLDRWQKNLIQVEPPQVELTFGRPDSKTPLIARFEVSTREEATLIVSSTRPEILVRVLEGGHEGEYGWVQEVEVTVPPSQTNPLSFSALSGFVRVSLEPAPGTTSAGTTPESASSPSVAKAVVVPVRITQRATNTR